MRFQLNGVCRFEQGRKGGAVYELERGALLQLDAEESATLAAALAGNRVEETAQAEGVLAELAERGCGFFSEERVFVETIRPYNHLLLLRPELRGYALSVAFLQLTSRRCPHDATHCASRFCSPCRITNSEEDREELHPDAWLRIVDELHASGIRAVILTGGAVADYKALPELVRRILSFGIECQIVVNSPAGIPENLPSGVGVIAFVCRPGDAREKEFTRALERLPRKNLIFAAPPAVERKHLHPCTLESFHRRLDSDSCLNGKIFITSGGRVVPCLQQTAAADTVGDLQTERFIVVYNRLAREHWNRPKRAGKCAVCELYFACSACSLMDAERVCHYDVNASEWASPGSRTAY